MKFWQKALITTVVMAADLAPPAVMAENKFLLQGVQEYNAGDYLNATGHLGAALSTEFNNAILHYYLASAYVHLKQKDGAIREFRIAYALEPEAEVGRLSKQALGYLAADLPTGSGTGPASALKPPDPAAKDIDKTLLWLKQQAQQAKDSRTGLGQIMADDAALRGDRIVQHSTSEILNNLPQLHHPGALQLPADAIRQMDTLRNVFQSQRSSCLQSGANAAAEIQKSADNLQGLLNEKPRPGTPKLLPAGTNLYTRNYQYDDRKEPPANSPPGNTKPRGSALDSIPGQKLPREISN